MWHFTAWQSRQYLQYLLDIWQLKQQKSLQLEAFPPIQAHAKFSPSSVLTMRNTILYHNSVMSRLMMSQVPKNTQVACTLDCIYLHPVHIQQGSHCLYNLATQRVLTHHCEPNDCCSDWDGQANCQARWHEQACATWPRWNTVLWVHLDCLSGLYRWFLWWHLSRPSLWGHLATRHWAWSGRCNFRRWNGITWSQNTRSIRRPIRRPTVNSRWNINPKWNQSRGTICG